jgi:hypothetical protein
MSSITKKAQNLEDRLVFLNEEINRLEKIKKEKEMSVVDYENSLSSQALDLRNEKCHLEKLINSLKNDIIIVREEEKSIKDIVEVKKSELDDLNSKVEEKNKELSSLSDKISYESIILKEKQFEIKKLIEESVDIIGKQNKKQVELEEKENKLDNTSKELFKQKDLLATKEKEIEIKSNGLALKEKELAKRESILNNDRLTLENEKEILLNKTENTNTSLTNAEKDKREATILLARANVAKQEADTLSKNIIQRDMELKEREAEFLLKDKELEAEKRLLKLKYKQDKI